MMKKIIFFLILVLAFLSFQKKASAYSPKAPNITGKVFNAISGYKNINLKKINKKIIIVNFWATWCPPCRAEIPELERFYKKNNKNVLIIGVNVNITKNGVKTFLKKYGVTYPVVHANMLEMESYGGINLIPQSFFINNYHHIVFHWQGEATKLLLNTVIKKMLSLQIKK